jgi:hypothetical protein
MELHLWHDQHPDQFLPELWRKTPCSDVGLPGVRQHRHSDELLPELRPQERRISHEKE